MAPEVKFLENNRLIAREFCFGKIDKVSIISRPWPDENVEEMWKGLTSVENPQDSPCTSGCSRFQAFEMVLKAEFSDVWCD
jgi:hypothetical protein